MKLYLLGYISESFSERISALGNASNLQVCYTCKKKNYISQVAYWMASFSTLCAIAGFFSN